MSSDIISQTRLKELLHYAPETGDFTWKSTGTGRRLGIPAGALNHGYISIRIDTVLYYAHRLAFLYIYGYMPQTIDHRNQCPSDNRIANLREVSHTDNLRNARKHRHNTSGCTGVGWHKRAQKWQAYVQVNDRAIYLGLFTDYFEACAARKSANNRYGFTELHGSDQTRPRHSPSALML